jgi:hypothetical protein
MTGTVPLEPIYLGGQAIHAKFYGYGRSADDPRYIEGTFTLIGGDASITMDALVGPQGIPGEASPIIRPEWGSDITDPADLPPPSMMTDADNGRAWYIDGSWYIWDNGAYHHVQGSIPGPIGPQPIMSVSAEQIDTGTGTPAYGPIQVDESGTELNPHFHIKIPGVPGPVGPAASISDAGDYDDTYPPESNDFLVYNGDTHLWTPEQPTILAPVKFTIPSNAFTDYSGSAGRHLIASLNVPPMPYDWYPDVLGHATIAMAILSTAQVEIEVRIGDAGASTGETEPLCGLGPFDPALAIATTQRVVNIIPHFSDVNNPGRAVAPGSDEGKVPAGQAKTLYVFTHVTGGSGQYIFSRGYSAQLRVNVEPVGTLVGGRGSGRRTGRR